MKFPFISRRRHEDQILGWESIHKDLQQRYDRVQHGYDQGVLEGKRQAYVNVRASLADLAFNTPALRAPLTQILSELGTEETRELDRLKGITKAREEFVSNYSPVDSFPENKKPQVAKHLGDFPVTGITEEEN